MAKQNFLKITSPKGEALYPYLKTPEKYEGEIVGLTIQAKFNQKDTTALINQLEKELERAKGDSQFSGKKWGKNPSMGYREDKNGDIVFKFKTKHEFIVDNKTITRTVPVFDAKGKPIDVSLGNGSIVRIAFQVVPYNKSIKTQGLSLWLDAVQVIELKTYGGGQDAGGFGFGEEEGYQAAEDDSSRFEAGEDETVNEDNGTVTDF